MKIKDKNMFVDDLMSVIDTSIQLHRYHKIESEKELGILDGLTKGLLQYDLKLTINRLLKNVI